MVVAAPQFLGTLHVPVVLGVDAVLVGTLAFALKTGAISSRVPIPSLGLALLAAFSALQALPLPSVLWAHVAHSNWEVYSRLFSTLGRPGPTFSSVSLDPGASRVEAVKWSMYAVAFTVAAGVGGRGFPRSGPMLVHGSALLLALVTLGHRLHGAQSVFGFYSPVGEFAKSSIGPLLNPNNLAGYLNLGIFCGLGLMLMRQPLPWTRWLLGLSVALMVGVVVESRSRGGLVALGVGMVALAPLARHLLPELKVSRSGRKVLAGVVATVLAGVALAALSIAPDSVRQGADGGLKKLAMTSWVLPLIHDYAWLGVGRGAFESAFQQYVVGQDNLIYSHPENFLVQWAAEWGVPCTLLVVVGLVALLRPHNSGATNSPVALGALLAVAVLLLQNLVDLGTEVPAIVIAALVALGTGWGAVASQNRSGRARRGWSWGLLGFAVFSWLGVVIFPVESVGSARVRLEGRLDELSAEPDPTRQDDLRVDIERAMLAHPAEAYFPRLAALLALHRHDPKAMRWIGRALELAPTSGRSHLLLARTLAAFGRRDQAILELRLSAAYDPGLATHVARIALGLSREADRLQRAAPEGITGAHVLVAMASELKDVTSLSLRATLLRHAIQRAPDLPVPRWQLTRLLLTSLEHDQDELCSGERRDDCIRQIADNASALQRLEPSSSRGLELRARLLSDTGRTIDASRELKAGCDQFEERRSCLQARLRAALAAGDAAEMDSATQALAAQTCHSTEDCAELSGMIADALLHGGKKATALTYYTRAAQEDGAEKRWMRVADVASEVGQHGLAVQALTNVLVRRGRDPKLQARIELERSRVMLQQ